ncbi:hypothetical protein PIB30_009159 [Stylosanthes scabra]|uniref:Uncharacterized protein n=1 Tax=Stylosanthes scabra TaxID=79078 RepID=A0ABU6Y262_9FABA|nr:hypothetical protein [Stylosanthes scabra]
MGIENRESARNGDGDKNFSMAGNEMETGRDFGSGDGSGKASPAPLTPLNSCQLKCYSFITSTTFFGSSPRTLSSASPRKEHFLSLILVVYSLSRLRSIGSLFGISVLNIGAVCGK